MTPFTFPILPQAFEQLGLCARLPTDDAAFIDWVRENQVSEAVVELPGDEPQWLEFTLDLVEKGKQPHLHLELARKKLESSAEGDFSIDHFVKLITEFLGRADQNPISLGCRGRIPVRLDDLPQNGTIVRMLKSPPRSMSVDAIHLSLDDDDVFYELNFGFNAEKRMVFAQLFSLTESPLDGDFVVRMVELFTLGANRYIFERLRREVTNG